MALAETTTNVPQWTLGDRLRKAREHAGISPEDMAKRLNVNKSSLYNWEADANRPRDLLSVVRQWAEITEVSAEWLLGLMYTSMYELTAVRDADLSAPYQLALIAPPQLTTVSSK